MQVAEQIVTAIGAHQWDGQPDGRTGPLAWLNEVTGADRPEETTERPAA